MDEASGALPAGFEFGAYVIGACIGQGGMARVYRAEHRALRKPVALKVMDGALLQRPDWRRRFLREGQSAAAVKHPNVVDITDVGVWQGQPYLVMEFLEGEDLERYLSRHKPLSEPQLARLMIPVIAGLATAHASGVVHRDLKPSNVFLARGPEGELVPKLLDFGISKLTSAMADLDPSSTPLGELMGSPMYMSPEAVRGARDLTPRSDQYSLGVVLYECVTGRVPFHGDSLLAVLEAVANGRFDPPRLHRPDLSFPLEEAILRAMSPEPEARYDNVREIGRALCHSADHRTRLLWMPSFGLSNPLEAGTTAVLRTAAPLHLPAPAVVRGGARLPWAALALLALAALVYFGRSRLRPEPAGEALAQPTVQALQPPLEAAPLLPALPAGSETEGGTSGVRGAPAPGPAGTAAPARAAASADPTRLGSERTPPRSPRRRDASAPRAEPSPQLVPVRGRKSPSAEISSERASGPPQATPALGPNRAPILD